MTKRFFLSKPLFLLAVAAGLGSILLIGLLSGLLAPKCSKSSTETDQIKTTPTPTTSFGASTTSTPTTTRTTTTTSSTSPSFTTTRPASNETFDENGIRLPTNVKPINYNLNIRVFYKPYASLSVLKTNQTKNDPDEYFEGTVIIDFELTEPTKRIIIHADESLEILDTIQIQSLSLKNMVNVRSHQRSNRNQENQFYEINLEQTLSVGLYKLKIDYKGGFGSSGNLVGFYKTRYVEDGQVKTIVATKFQPIDARKAFPCFDEPALKATYEIALEHPVGSKALSNWPENPRTNLPNNRYRTTFPKTYSMSTYLAAWAILPEDFASEEAFTQKGVKLRVFARKAAVNKGLVKFAIEAGVKSIDFFENEYFFSDLKAMPPKTDMIAFPDFTSGAMEHWGIIGYRETSLLYSEQTNSISNKQSVAFTIAHEIAHFWFGNLVTCKWWDDLWLNEAMARFLQFKAIQSIYPDWDVENQFLTLYQIPVMFDDGFQTSTPVSVEIVKPSQITSAFSSITYDKGSSLLRMLEQTVGPFNFQEGLNIYLSNNEFGSSEAKDFYNSLQLPPDMPNITPQEYMERWLLQKNYPLVFTKLEVNSATGKSKVTFQQDRFLLSEEEIPDLQDDDSPFGYKWPIYLKCRAGGTYNSLNGQNEHLNGETDDFSYFLDNIQGSIELDRRYTWIKCNRDFKGFYVTDYPLAMYEAFNELLVNNVGRFSIGDRANLLHVSYSLAYVGFKSYGVPALLTNYLEFWETEYVPWRTFTWHMNRIATLLEQRPSFLELKGFGEFIARILFKKLDIWNTNTGTHSEKLLKINVIDFICRLQEELCLKNTTKLFNTISPDYFVNPNDVAISVAPNLRSLIYKYHVQNSYEFQDIFKLYDVYGVTIDPQEKSYTLNSLAQTRSAWILDYFLDSLLEENSQIRPQDFFTLVVAISRNPTGRHIAWYFIREYWYEIIQKFGINSRPLANAVKSICETFENFFLYEEMKEFFSITNPGAGSLQRLQAEDIVIHNILWILEREDSVQENLFIPRSRFPKL